MVRKLGFQGEVIGRLLYETVLQELHGTVDLQKQETGGKEKLLKGVLAANTMDTYTFRRAVYLSGVVNVVQADKPTIDKHCFEYHYK